MAVLSSTVQVWSIRQVLWSGCHLFVAHWAHKRTGNLLCAHIFYKARTHASALHRSTKSNWIGSHCRDVTNIIELATMSYINISCGGFGNSAMMLMPRPTTELASVQAALNCSEPHYGHHETGVQVSGTDWWTRLWEKGDLHILLMHNVPQSLHCLFESYEKPKLDGISMK